METKRNGEDDRQDKRDENEDSDEERAERFVETRENPEIFKIKYLNQSRDEMAPFYNGMTLDSRMAEVRQSIYHIRQNWGDYWKFLESLKQLLLEDGGLDFEDKQTQLHCEQIMSSKREWLTVEQSRQALLNYEAVKLYTSKEGHSRIYRIANCIFRQKELESSATIRSIVFLIELINIDLYNYCLVHPEKTNFEGTVYRGMGVTDDDLTAFRSLREEPVGKRNIAVPLGLFASSSSLKVAKKFIKAQLERSTTPLRPLLLKIHVIGLKIEFIKTYSSRFPNSVLTTICAVDIHDISRYPGEKEVILRGPFILVLDVYEDENIHILKQPCTVIEAVMLNANRDHISTSLLGTSDAQAREMFASMVTITRSEFAIDYCRKKNMSDDERAFQKVLDESCLKLEEVSRK